MIGYIVQSRIGDNSANVVQVMKMAQVFVELGLALHMVAQPGIGPHNRKRLALQYGVRNVPSMTLIECAGRCGIHFFNWRAVSSVRQTAADVVITRSVGAAAFAAWRGIPTIFECHAPPQRAERLLFRLLRCSPNFKRLVVISDALKRILVAQYPALEGMDIIVAHDGVDLDAYEVLPDVATAKDALGLDPSRYVAGYSGHLYEGRGIDVILSCAAGLPNWDFVLAGGMSEDVNRWQQETQSRGLSNVKFLGFVENQALPATLAAADVLLMPYQAKVFVSGGKLETSQWMSPLKMFEYLAMERAIISSDLPVLREILTPELCRLVSPGNPDEWIRALQSLENATIRQDLASKARAAAAKHTWKDRVSRMCEDYL